MARYYESDITRLMRDLLKEKPQIAEDQRKGRSIWWDKKPDPDARQEKGESRIPQQAYVYQTRL